MISFIVIGRNEGWKLGKCLESIYSIQGINNRSNYEVIYVDSQSTDGSIERVKSFAGTRVFQITGDINAAIARNIGARESKGNLLFFLDGDMEINPGFVPEAIKLYNEGYRFIGGQVEEYFYSREWQLLDKRLVFSKKNLNKHNLTNGGGFVIERDLWLIAGGMKTKYDRSQDIDLNYRLIKEGYPIFRSEKKMFIHHTIQYNHDFRLFYETKKIRRYFFKGLLIREHIFNIRIVKRNLRINYSLFVLLFSTLLSGLLQSFIPLGFYAIVIIIRSVSQFLKQRKSVKTGIFQNILKVVFLDLSGIIGVLFFFPLKKATIYEEV